MYCIPLDIPQSLCEIDDELKAIYHSKDAVCIWVFGSREDRNNFVDETSWFCTCLRGFAFFENIKHKTW